MSKRIPFFIAALVLVAGVMSAAKALSAAAILADLRAKMNSSPAVEAVFTINGGEGPVQGSVLLSGARYHMTTPQMSVWYDGQTQWTLLQNASEVNISEPSADELMSSNPFAILNAHASYYTARRLSDSNGRLRVELTPRDKNTGIRSFVIYVNSTTHWPAVLIVRFEDNRSIEVTIDNISATRKPAPSAFTFDSKKYPTIELIDLR